MSELPETYDPVAIFRFAPDPLTWIDWKIKELTGEYAHIDATIQGIWARRDKNRSLLESLQAAREMYLADHPEPSGTSKPVDREGGL
jgi:hypothetical protein